MTLAEAPLAPGGIRCAPFFAASWFLYSVVHGQLAGACSSWEPSVQLKWRLRLPCLRCQDSLLFTFCSSFHSTGFGASCSLRVSPGHAPVPTPAATLCGDLSIGTSLPPQVGEPVPAAVLLAIFHPLPASVLKEPLLEGASQLIPVRDRSLLCRIFVRVGFHFRGVSGMIDA